MSYWWNIQENLTSIRQYDLTNVSIIVHAWVRVLTPFQLNNDTFGLFGQIINDHIRFYSAVDETAAA